MFTSPVLLLRYFDLSSGDGNPPTVKLERGDGGNANCAHWGFEPAG